MFFCCSNFDIPVDNKDNTTHKASKETNENAHLKSLTNVPMHIPKGVTCQHWPLIWSTLKVHNLCWQHLNYIKFLNESLFLPNCNPPKSKHPNMYVQYVHKLSSPRVNSLIVSLATISPKLWLICKFKTTVIVMTRLCS